MTVRPTATGDPSADVTAGEAERALRAAREFIAARVSESRGTDTLIAFDAGFQQAYPLGEARRQIDVRMGVDIGYDLGADLSAAIYGVALVAPEEEELIAGFARLIEKGRVGHRYRFFLDHNAFPADVDCTAVAGHALYELGRISRDEYVMIARELLLAATGEEDDSPHSGVVSVYWDDGYEGDTLTRGRKYDPVVGANALCVLKQARNLGLEDGERVIAATQRHVTEHLLSRAHLKGSRYYPYPDPFIYAVSRLVRDFPDCRETLRAPLAEAISKRDAESGVLDGRTTALNLALRSLAARNIGLPDGDRSRLRLLLGQQRPDGSWPASPCFTLGRIPVYFGSRLLSTLFAAHALRSSHGGDNVVHAGT